MNFFGDFYFLMYMALAMIPAIILGIYEKPIKYYSFLISILFLGMSLLHTPKAAIYMIAFCIFELLLLKIWLLTVSKLGRKQWLFRLFLALGMAPLVISKVCGSLHMSVFAFIGISYMTFKILQMIIEIYDLLIKEVSIFNYLSFILFFPSILSGPIDRSRRYEKDLNTLLARKDYLDMLGQGIFKILQGILYKFVIAASLYQAILWLGMAHTLKSALIYMYSYGLYLFFDFAGYSLMAIGCAYIFGIKLPDNFKNPFFSKDITDFWNRWHITLSHWFRDYLFSRLMMIWIKNKTFNNRLVAACFGFIINMTVMGLWHGFTVYYILYGFYHGLLLSLTEIWQKKSKFHKKHKKEKTYIVATTIITFNLVMFGLFIFSGRFTELLMNLIR